MAHKLTEILRGPLTLAQCAELACLLEVSARKPGNVHPQADFATLRFVDLLVSAVAVGPVLEQSGAWGIGRTVLECVRRTRELVGTNTNLGIALLLAPLCAVPIEQRLEVGVQDVLNRLTIDDARFAYQAIRLAQPGGLGESAEQDAHGEPTMPLRDIMRLAADRDLIAAQYANGFEQVFWAASLLTSAVTAHLDLEQAVIMCHLELMANYPDTLIARKRGTEEAMEAARRAARVLAAEWPATPESHRLLADLDEWLRAVGHERNPGTTADLVAASLFVTIRHRCLQAG